MSCMVSEYFKTEIKKIRARFTERIPAATYSYQSTQTGMILVLAGGQTCSVEEKGSHIP